MKKLHFYIRAGCNVGCHVINRKNSGLSIFIICFLFFSNQLCAQQADSLRIGRVKGKVKDSAYNFMLMSATVAVYKDADSSLVQFTLPNSFGEFTVQPLPLNVPLHLVITHVGYKPLFKRFLLTKSESIFDFRLLYMYQNTDKNGNMMEEVVVKAKVPMRMNGDTLEFNADAFRLDSNATAEDLMRRLPGFTIWGDGDITFNGKKINAVLVEGKPFMGTSDVTIATQNLPKDAIDKIQVYQQRDEKNPLDSTMFANIKLKEDKKTGCFGKVSAGYGLSNLSPRRDKRYVADGMLSGFNRKMQITTVAAGNNVNKLARDVDALLRNSSFKGEGANLEYQSNFNMRGVNRPVMGGVRLQSDFVTDGQFPGTSRLNADYFINHNATDVIDTSLERTFITPDTILSRRSNSLHYNESNDQRAGVQYVRETEKHTFNISASGTINEDKNKNESSSIQEKTGVGVVNKNSSVSESNNTAKNMQAGFSLTRRDPHFYENTKRVAAEFTVGYTFIIGENAGKSKNQNSYEFAKEPQRNRNVSRVYDQRNSNSVEHKFNVSYPRLKELIFGKKGGRGIDMELSASYRLIHNDNNDAVRDLDTSTHNYIDNTGLTYNRTETVRDFIPKFGLSKRFYKGLTNRYNKSFSINVNAAQQFYNYANNSTQAIQNLGYNYKKFIPDASIEYSNHQYGQYEAKYSIDYKTRVNYPTVWQMAPLADVANPLYLPKGNSNLKPEYQQDVNFNYSFTTRKPKNPWNINSAISLGKTTDNIVDSTLYDNGGGRTVYMTNVGGNKYLTGNVIIRKSLAINKVNTFELGAHYDFSLSNDPRYIDSKLNTSINRKNGAGFNVNYRYKDIVQAKVEQGLNYNNAEQRGFRNNRFKSNSRYTRAIVTLQFPENLTWSSNVTGNRSVANGADAINFTIWNASLTYRFLKGNQGEVKFSALDLLKQNKGITNTVNGNVQNFGYTNVLQQYFMLTLAYYPRKFGK